ncbi:phage tail sheath subtilisin-like domain-containing protein [Anaerotruncus rubiinfantis]|uniref:phage tail sheath subtilisin-like domain-containing protein n=1 Tax=Anaerotruncus rubiinfantis TaxID=1720200 RepID=UPI00189C3011|nr:phage tail sheath subtilisin-like domain-containing protein [Anaerotruncus rubiinfantis]
MIDRVIPGVSVETIAGEREAQLGTLGVVAMPLELSWGAAVTEIERGDDTTASLGHRLSDPAIKLVGEVMNYANKLVLYRLTAGTQATGTLASGITAKAVYGGKVGNNIKVVVVASGDNWSVKTFLGTVEMDEQIIAAPVDFQTNDFIQIEGTGTLAAATVSLTGGADATADAEDYDAFLAEIQKYDYNVMAYTGSDSAIANKLIGFIGEQRESGTMVQLVQSVVSADDPAIYKSTIGGKTLNYDLTAAEACATMAGIIAKCGIDSSATHFDGVEGWMDVSTRLTIEQQKTKTRAGELLFVLKNGKVIVLYDINSLITYTDQKPKDFHKGLVMRTLDSYQTDLQLLLDQKVIGKIRNGVDGRNQIKGMIAKMTVENYLNPGYVEGFTADDITVIMGTDRDSVKATVGIRVVDTVDKIYVTVISQ